MQSTRNKNKVGLIYCTEPFKSVTKQSVQKQQNRKRVGSITGMTPKRNLSVGKIITRPFTPKKMLSIQIQTTDIIPIMEAKAIQVQNIIQAKIQKNNENNMRTSHNKIGFLKMADFNVLSQQANILSKTIRKKCQNLYNKEDKQNLYKREDKQLTVRKEDKSILFKKEEKQQNRNVSKQEFGNFKRVKIVQPPSKITNQSKQVFLPITATATDRKQDQKRQPLKPLKKQDRNTRQQKISKLTALYEKNLAKYQSSKVALVDLLKQNKTK